MSIKQRGNGSERHVRQEHTSMLTRRIDRRIAEFAERYGAAILRGRPLPAEAVEQFSELANDSRRLLRTVKRLEDWFV